MKIHLEILSSNFKSFICFNPLILFLSKQPEMKHRLSISSHFIVVFCSQKLEKHYVQKQRNILTSILSMTVCFQLLKTIQFKMLSNRMSYDKVGKNNYKKCILNICIVLFKSIEQRKNTRQIYTKFGGIKFSFS